MKSLAKLALASLLFTILGTPAFAQAAIQEPGLFSFYYPDLDVSEGGTPKPAARLSPDWPRLKGACAALGGGYRLLRRTLLRSQFCAQCILPPSTPDVIANPPFR